jgi:hypothetical protein
LVVFEFVVAVNVGREVEQVMAADIAVAVD